MAGLAMHAELMRFPHQHGRTAVTTMARAAPTRTFQSLKPKPDIPPRRRYRRLTVALNRRRNAPAQRTQHHRVRHPKDELRDKAYHEVLSPEVHRAGIVWRQGVVMRAPIASNGEEHDDGHGDSRGKTISHECSCQRWPSAKLHSRAGRDDHQSQKQLTGEVDLRGKGKA